jgi:hypothetical protein
MNKQETFLIGLAVAGLCLIAWGATSGFPFLTSVGGALFGSCLGSFIGRIAKRDLTEQIKRMVREALFPSFTTEENKIDAFRRLWHIYHVTEMDGKFVWRHRVADFGKIRIPGRLTAEISRMDKQGSPATNIFEGASGPRKNIYRKLIRTCGKPWSGWESRTYSPGLGEGQWRGLSA